MNCLCVRVCVFVSDRGYHTSKKLPHMFCDNQHGGTTTTNGNRRDDAQYEFSTWKHRKSPSPLPPLPFPLSATIKTQQKQIARTKNPLPAKTLARSTSSATTSTAAAGECKANVAKQTNKQTNTCRHTEWPHSSLAHKFAAWLWFASPRNLVINVSCGFVRRKRCGEEEVFFPFSKSHISVRVGERAIEIQGRVWELHPNIRIEYRLNHYGPFCVIYSGRRASARDLHRVYHLILKLMTMSVLFLEQQ